MRTGRIFQSILLIVCLVSLTGCSIRFEFTKENPSVFSSGEYSLSEDEVAFIGLQYKVLWENCYAKVLSDSFWEMEVADGCTFETYVKEYMILPEMRALLCLNNLAPQYNTDSFNKVEENLLQKSASDLYNQLSSDEKNFIHGSEETVYRVLKYYRIAEKTIAAMVTAENLEVSDEESRMVDLYVTSTPDLKKANAMAARVSTGDDFDSVCREILGVSPQEFTVSRLELIPSLRDTVFSLKNNEISGPFLYQGRYYLIQMKSSFNSLLSGTNKQNLLAERRYDGWAPLFERYAEENTENLNHAFWKSFRLQVDGNYPYFNFF